MNKSEKVVNHALEEAAYLLGISPLCVAQTLDVKATWFHCTFGLRIPKVCEEDKSRWNRAIIFLDVVCTLLKLQGLDPEHAGKWLKNHNNHLDGVPAKIIRRSGGLFEVAEYLHYMAEKA